MSSVQNRPWALVRDELQTLWRPTDIMMVNANAVMFVLAMLSAPSRAERFALGLLHALVMLLAYAVVKADREPSPRFTPIGFLHAWLPAGFTLLLFFELGVVAPRIHPFHDYRYDRLLQDLDVRLLGDPAAFIAGIGSRWLSDVLALCYTAYYPFAVFVPALLYARGAAAEFRSASSIIMCSFMLTYTGYLLVPAIGPHLLFDGPRAQVLDGYGLARISYAWMRDVPFEPPDAFPSGHALMGMLVPALAWRWCRRCFPALAIVGAGIVLATIYLRYHYISDVLASLVLAPVAWRLGWVIDRRYRDPA